MAANGPTELSSRPERSAVEGSAVQWGWIRNDTENHAAIYLIS
jgi:hypothetical protein